jgi:hypothetical protein
MILTVCNRQSDMTYRSETFKLDEIISYFDYETTTKLDELTLCDCFS